MAASLQRWPSLSVQRQIDDIGQLAENGDSSKFKQPAQRHNRTWTKPDLAGITLAHLDIVLRVG